MSLLRCQISVSLDGFVAGPNQSADNPLGEGGTRLHEWAFNLAAWRGEHGDLSGEVNESTPVFQESRENIGAGIMGRNMFGPPEGGPWGADPWNGWWGEDPPYHYPVFVLTHHAREPLVLEGGNEFYFVTDGIESALEQAKATANGKDVMLWGGGQTVNEYLAAGLVDELELHVSPVTLGAGSRLFDFPGADQLRLNQLRAVQAPMVTHLKYRVERPA